MNWRGIREDIRVTAQWLFSQRLRFLSGGAYYVELAHSATANRVATLPDKDGTVATLDDVAAQPITATSNTNLTGLLTGDGSHVGSTAQSTSSIPDSLNRRYVTDAELTVIGNTSGTNSGNETTTTIGSLVAGATGKTTPVDADTLGLSDSAAGGILKSLTWANVKATLKTYFDTLYASAASPGTLLQTKYASDGSAHTIVGTYTVSDTAPTSANGDQLLTVTLTPHATTNILRVHFSCMANSAVGYNMTAILLQDSTAACIASNTVSQDSGTDYFHTLTLDWVFVAGTTSSTTIKIRVASDHASGMTVNSTWAGLRRLGGTAATVLIVDEIKV